ncbi:hypothetical protein F5Y19DRAFT_14022 [Xylariaceae sp. FL1651]|nr:hypothetical protein F5Y19DRAFT_14022 [Xylariaceae sp. FL1651]
MSSKAAAPTITVSRGFKDAGQYVWSPYVTKLEARLRFGGVSYKTDAGSPRSGPKGKIPYITLQHAAAASTSPTHGKGAEAGQQLGDSTLIAKALCEGGVMTDLNARLSKAERAYDLALRSLLEDRLSFYLSWERWTQHYYTMRDHVLWPVPWPLRVFVGSMVYRNTVATLHGQGTGRLTPEEIATFRHEVLESFADLLLESRAKAGPAEGGEPFWVLGGPGPTDVDATLFGFMASMLMTTAGPSAQADAKSFPVLLEFVRRVHERYFSDYEAMPM